MHRWSERMPQRNVPEDCAEWVGEADRLMKRDWYIDTVDAGLDDEDVIGYWKSGDSPEEFVAWFAEKRDLYDFRHPWKR